MKLKNVYFYKTMATSRSDTAASDSEVFISWDEPFSINCLLQMDSNEAIAASYGGYVQPYLLPNNAVNEGNGFNWVGKLKITNLKADDFFRTEPVTIGKGKSKSFSAFFARMLPDVVSAYGLNEDKGLTNEELFKKYSGDNGNARAYPIGLEVEACDEYGNGRYYYAFKKNVATFLLWREDPIIEGYTITDNRIIRNGETALDYFGSFVQNESIPVLTFQYKLDSIDTTLTATSTLTVHIPDDSQTIKEYVVHDSGTFIIDVPETPGTYTWDYVVTDSTGRSAMISGEFEVLAYTKPTIANLSAERYVEGTSDAGEITYTAVEDGSYVRFYLNYDVASVAGKNAWNMYIYYGIDDSQTYIQSLFSESKRADGISENIFKDRSLITDLISPAYRWNFYFVLQDCFEEASAITYTESSGADFSVEAGGTAIGMRSRGVDTDGQRRFEVAPGYKSIMYGGIYGVTDYSRVEQRTYGTWIDGKPIYKKTISVEVLKTNTDIEADVVDDDLETVVGLDGVWIRKSNGRQYPITYRYSDNSYANCFVNEEKKIQACAGWAGTVYATVFYTKASDDTENEFIPLVDVYGNYVKDSSGSQISFALETGASVQLQHTAAEVDIAIDQAEDLYVMYQAGELKGEDGYTPVKGTDYYTDEDKDELIDQLVSEVIVVQPEAPSDTSAIWIDTDDNYDDGFSEAVNIALRQAKENGEFDGASVAVQSVSESDADGGSNIITFTDGKTITIKNGSKGGVGDAGADGPAGVAGYTPVKGIDYYTHEDKQEITTEITVSVLADIQATEIQQTPLFANSIAECLDASKVYVLPDGYIYAYKKVNGYTNLLETSIDTDGSLYNGKGYKDDYRLGAADNPTESAKDGMFLTGFIPIKKTDVIRVSSTMWAGSPSAAKIWFYNASFKLMAGYTQNGYVMTYNGYAEGTNSTSNSLQSKTAQSVTVNGNETIINIAYSPNCTDVAYIRFDGCGSGANAIITLNEPIAGNTEAGYGWGNTGHAFIPADYEDRIITLESKTADSPLKGKTIAVLGDSISSVQYTVPNYWQMIATKTGCDFLDYGVSGSCIANGSTSSTQSFVQRASSMDASADCVLVMGGTNDYGKGILLGDWSSTDNTTLYGALNELITLLRTKYNGKPIIFCTPIRNKDEVDNGFPKTIEDLKSCGASTDLEPWHCVLAIQAKCAVHGIPVIDLYNNSGIGSGQTSYFRADDKWHPSTLGECRIANMVQPMLEQQFLYT